MKKIVFFLLFTTAALGVHSQDFMIKHNGDTLRGEIRLSDKSLIVTGQDGVSKAFSADDISYLSNTKYKGAVLHCNLMLYSDNIDVVNKWNYNGGNKTDTVLILKEAYFTPKMILYEVPDNDKSIYYFVKKPSDSLPIQMLVDYKMMKYTTTKGYVMMDPYTTAMVQQKYYVDQLRVMMADCDKITSDVLDQMDYRIYSFKNLIKRYSKCK